MIPKIFLLTLLLLATSTKYIYAELQSQVIDYMDGDTVLEGYIVYDDNFNGKRPGIMVVHEWTGLGPYEKMRADQLAKLGYVALAADIYGKGIRPNAREEASKQAGIYRNNRQLMRNRAKAGIVQLKKHPLVNNKDVAAIGYCFGGGVVLELARSGADVQGVVSFHGNLDTPHPEDARTIKAKVLVLHGADDPHVPSEQINSFKKEMGSAGVDWQIISYQNAVHSFTNPSSGNDPSKGAAYNEKADKQSWSDMLTFFRKIFLNFS
ncbi:MAG: dienelactone hydrolase [Omnitrophica WOR_2 bacterium GWF2_38_59]|nr:MAG: dienelactone hydrolase [Omnitrophica WOR_2 bacterium GWF2_38_59]OGX54321.1 MAG: dienelactone hydrolase [Omnitrophica WOR_2 bacterium RIFOXYA12_FULL_38_10]OGX59755.1 MAG: dienelactone hydrolase [Omnitrophica WOR_2 bacterium RIFOXYC2_FULL_38_12]HBG61593.1 dienelactone hydrolase [Candidatus Omnitrophota bacterium]